MVLANPSRARWVVGPAPERRAKLRLFCFPYAGGGASVFHRWKEALPADVEVCAIQLPGRESRVVEEPVDDWSALIGQLEAAIVPWTDRPFAFFGHSLGAAVAFEVARALRRHGHPQPMHLFVSGRRAPHRVADRPPIHALPHSQFVAELRTLNGTPDEVLRNEELMELLIPALRADFRLSETYRYEAEPPLDVPISAFGGTRDDDTSAAEVDAWREHTTRVFRREMFSGGHFFLAENRGELLAELGRGLRPALGALAPA